MKHAGVVLCLALVVGVFGCGPSHNSVEEADREGIDVQRQILLAQDVELDRIEAAIKEEPALKTATVMPIIERMREKNTDAKAIAAQLLANFHAPQQPKIYSHAEVQSLIKRMLDAHTMTFWASVAGAVLAGAGGIIALARSPLAKMIPGVGTILSSLDGTMAAVETWMKKMKDGGQPEVAAGLASVLQEAHKVPAVAKFIDKRLGKVQAAVESGEAVEGVKPEAQAAMEKAADEALNVQSSATA